MREAEQLKRIIAEEARRRMLAGKAVDPGATLHQGSTWERRTATQVAEAVGMKPRTFAKGAQQGGCHDVVARSRRREVWHVKLRHEPFRPPRAWARGGRQVVAQEREGRRNLAQPTLARLGVQAVTITSGQQARRVRDEWPIPKRALVLGMWGATVAKRG